MPRDRDRDLLYSSNGGGMSTTTKCQHGLVFSTLALLILIVALVVFLSPVTHRSGAFVTPVTRTSNVSATTPYSAYASTVVVVQQAEVIPVDTVVVSNDRDNAQYGRGYDRRQDRGQQAVVVPADTVVVTNANAGNTNTGYGSAGYAYSGNDGASYGNTQYGRGSDGVQQAAVIPADAVLVTNTNTDRVNIEPTYRDNSGAQYVRGDDGVVYTVPSETASAVVAGTSGDNHSRGKRDINGVNNRGYGSIVVTVYPTSVYGSGYMVSGNISSLVPAETYVVTFHQFGDMSGGCSQLGQGLRVGNGIPTGGVNTEATGDNYVRHAVVSNGTIITVADSSASTGHGATLVVQNADPVATSNLNTGYTNYAPSNYGNRNYVPNNNYGGRGGNAAVLQPVRNGSNYVTVNQDGVNQTYYSGARAFGQNYNQNGLPSNVAYVIPGIDYSGNDTSYYNNDPNGVFNKLNPVSVKGTGNNDHVFYQNNTQNDESNVKFLPLQTVNATENFNDNYVPVTRYSTNDVPRDNYGQQGRGGRRGRIYKRQAGSHGGTANRRVAQDYNGAAIGTFVADASGNGRFDFYIPEDSACGNPQYLYGRTVAIRPVYGVTRNKRQIVTGQPEDGVYGRDINGFEGTGTTYQRINNAGATGVQRVAVIRSDRLMPVDANYAGQMRNQGMRSRFQRMINRPTMQSGMRMGQPISCGILGRA